MAVCQDIAACTTSIILLSIWWLVIIPYLLYWIVELSKNLQHASIIARYSKVLYLCTINCFILMTLRQTYNNITTGLQIEVPSFINTSCNMILGNLELLCGYLFAWRYYLTFYSFNYTESIIAKGWKQLLLNNTNNNNNNENKKFQWFVSHKSTFGSYKYTSKILFSFIICLWMINIFVSIFIGLDAVYTLSFLETAPPFILACIVWCKTPVISDEFWVRAEMKVLAVCILLFFIIQPVLWIIVKMTNSAIITVLLLNTTSLWMASAVYITVKMVLCKTIENYQKKEEITASNMIQHNFKPFGLLREVLKNEDAINHFMKHLQKEFCVENMFCYIEIIQFLSVITNKKWDDYGVDTDKLYVEISESIPYSIVENDQEIMDMVGLLNEKYFSNSAQFQINISSALYNSIGTFINDYKGMSNEEFNNNTNVSKQKLIDLMIAVCDVLLKLLSQSMTRFKKNHPQKIKVIVEILS